MQMVDENSSATQETIITVSKLRLSWLMSEIAVNPQPGKY